MSIRRSSVVLIGLSGEELQHSSKDVGLLALSGSVHRMIQCRWHQTVRCYGGSNRDPIRCGQGGLHPSDDLVQEASNCPVNL
jgi:hypothetical protein